MNETTTMNKTYTTMETTISTTTTTTTTTETVLAEVSSISGNKSEKSILIDLILGTNECLKQEEDLNFINDIKQKVSFLLVFEL